MTDMRGPGVAALNVLDALAVVAAEGDAASGTTSGLSIDEQLAIAQVGYEAQDIVSGSAVARLGSYAKYSVHPYRNYEVSRLSELLTSAREQAVRQMQDQCNEIGAAGVIGVHLDFQGTEEDDLVTFVASGTAVRPIGVNGGADAATFTSSLSGQDFQLLLRSECTPIGLVVGTSVYHFGWRSLARWVGSQGRCTELASLTESLYSARESAIEYLSRRATSLEADGVIGVNVVERPDVWGSHVIEFMVYGTAIKMIHDLPRRIDPQIVVSLDDVEVTASEPGPGSGNSSTR